MKIILIKFMSIGDAVMSTVGIQMIRTAFPAAKITILTLDSTAPIYKYCKSIDEVIAEPTEIFWNKRNYLKISRSIIKWRVNQYDLAVSFHVGKGPNTLVDLLRADIKVIPGRNELKSLVSFDGKSFYPGINHYTEAYPGIAREAIFAAEGIKSEGIPNPRIDFTDDELKEYSSLLAGYGLKEKGYLSVFPGGGHNPGNQVVIKRYPKMTEALGLFAAKNRNAKIVLIGAATDKDCTDAIKSKIDQNQVIDLVGKTSLRQFAGIINGSAMLVTTDSSALHIGQACHVPIVAIFGPTDPKEFVDPRANVKIIAPIKTKPIYTGKYFGREVDALGAFNEITPEYVAETIEKTWKEINENTAA